MAKGKKKTPDEVKKIRETAVKYTTQDADGNIDVNLYAVAKEAGTDAHTVKKYTEDDPNYSKALKSLLDEGYALLGSEGNRAARLAVKRCKALEGNEDIATASEIRALQGVFGDHAKMLQMLSGKPTEVVSGQIEVKKFDEW